MIADHPDELKKIYYIVYWKQELLMNNLSRWNDVLYMKNVNGAGDTTTWKNICMCRSTNAK